MGWTCTDEEFVRAVAENRNIHSVLKALGMSCQRSNYRTVRRRVEKMGLDTSHWRSRPSTPSRQRPLEEVLVENSTYDRGSLKRRLAREGLLKERCAVCGSNPTWQGQPLILVLDHVNGIHNDHRLENLRLLCPNCNSQTATFSGRNRRRPAPRCRGCGREISPYSSRCRACAPKARKQPQKIAWPDRQSLLQMVEQHGWRGTGRRLGVSDNAVRKHLKN